jgi:peptidase inhibitor family I36
MKPSLRSLAALAFLILIGTAVGSLSPAGAAQDDCRVDAAAHAYHCIWDQENFQGTMKPIGPAEPAEFAGQCVNYSIRSAANNGKSGFATLYVYEQANCAGESAIQLQAGESAGSVTARSARFGPKGAYR